MNSISPATHKKTRICFVVSYINRAVSFEWIVEHLDPTRFDVSFLLLNPGRTLLEDFLKSRNIPVKTICLRRHSDYPLVFLHLLWHFFTNRIDVVNTHLFDASFLGILAAKIARIPHRIVTRHHSSFHHTVNKRAVWADRFITWLSTHVIAASKVVYTTLTKFENAPEEEVSIVNYGFDLSVFKNISNERVSALKRKYGIENTTPVIGVISRFIAWKGIQYIIPAFQEILKDFPSAVLILANASGPATEDIHEMLSALPKNSYRVIKFETDFPALYKLFDVFVHAPINSHAEAFGQVYVEALAAEVPSVFTVSGICSEFIVDGKNAILADYKDSESIARGIRMILKNEVDVESLKKCGKESVERFAMENMIRKLDAIYSAGH